MANFYLAFEQNLKIIPVLNKIDLKNAQPEVVIEQMQNLFDVESDEVLKVRLRLVLLTVSSWHCSFSSNATDSVIGNLMKWSKM